VCVCWGGGGGGGLGIFLILIVFSITIVSSVIIYFVLAAYQKPSNAKNASDFADKEVRVFSVYLFL
jgi:uncharacterized membrane protein